jgi:membrane glycosyltransferase
MDALTDALAQAPAVPVAPAASAVERHAPCTPTEAPLLMPAQSLRACQRPARRAHASFVAHLARLLGFVGTLALSAFGAYEMHAVVAIGGVTALEWVMVGLFATTFGWIAFAAVSSITGVLLGWQRLRAPADAPLTTRTAIVMPVYNEDPARTFAALQAMGEALVDGGYESAFELFVLSDTTQAEIWLQETAAFAKLQAAFGGTIPVWYRRRYRNTARKAGNIQDFVERWGARYDYMVVLDADSIMAAATLVTLVREMQADEWLGILQTVPALANGQALLPRLQQFASRLYGPVVARGLAAWQGADGNYWGHNAIIRVGAFAQSCGLPELRGAKPFGGAIQSHDFVEAAFMRRAGWSVRMLSTLEGSWEEGPPSLLDAAVRDRRWAQGNLQHLAVLPARGLRWPSRMHLLIGVMSYLASPLWIALIVIGLALALQAAIIRPEYFTSDFQLFPTWPRFDAERMIRLFIITMSVLLLPKALGLLRALCVRTLRGSVGMLRLVAGAVVELVLSALYAPIMMVIQCRQLWEILRGHDSGWSTQRRDNGTTPWRELVHRHWLQSVIGMTLAGGLYYLSPPLLAWMSPTLLGLVLAIPLSRASGSRRVGRLLRWFGLLVIPEEIAPPVLMQRRDALAPDYEALVARTSIETLTRDAQARHAHFRTLLPHPLGPRGQPDVERLTARSKIEEARSVREALSWLTPRERVALLSDAAMFGQLQEREA